jgi:hypothetical protein
MMKRISFAFGLILALGTTAFAQDTKAPVAPPTPPPVAQAPAPQVPDSVAVLQLEVKLIPKIAREQAKIGVLQQKLQVEQLKMQVLQKQIQSQIAGQKASDSSK